MATVIEPGMSIELVPLCRATDVAPGRARKCMIAGRPPLAVFNVGGEFFVIDDTCTHGMASLSEGTLEGDVIECPWHGGAFNVRTGQAVAAPCTVDVRTYAITIERDQVCLVEKAGPQRPPFNRSAAEAPSPAEPQPTAEGSEPMTLDDLTARVRRSVGEESGLNATVKFAFPDEGVIYIDGLSKPNSVDNIDRDSTITITLTRETFQSILDKRLNPKFALMTGKLRLRGDIRIAMRLDRVFGLE